MEDLGLQNFISALFSPQNILTFLSPLSWIYSDHTCPNWSVANPSALIFSL